jgi:hypothetical protein
MMIKVIMKKDIHINLDQGKNLNQIKIKEI